MCVDGGVCVCVFQLRSPSQTLFCGFFFSGIIKVSDSAEGWRSHCMWAILKEFLNHKGCWDTIAIKRQTSAKETKGTQMLLNSSVTPWVGGQIMDGGTETLFLVQILASTITVQ